MLVFDSLCIKEKHHNNKNLNKIIKKIEPKTRDPVKIKEMGLKKKFTSHKLFCFSFV